MTPTQRTESNHSDHWFLLLALSLALVLRLDFQIANNFVIDADEAIIGLMAKHILEGGPIPVFYYGQPYMGSFEAILASMVFAVWGISSVALKAVPLAFSLLFVVLTYAVGRALGGRNVARLAAFLAAAPPSTLLVWSAKARGGFIEIMCIGSLALLVTIYWLKRDKPSLRHTILTGLLLGFGWWVNNQVVYFMLPIGFVYTARLLHLNNVRAVGRIALLLKHGAVGAICFLIGGLPFWVYNLNHEFESFGMFGTAPDLSKHLSGFFSTALPILFGAKRIWQHNDAFPMATVITWIIYATLFTTLLVARRKQIAALFTFTIDRKQPIELLGLFLLACSGVFIFSSFGWLSEAPRYLLPMYLGIFVLAALGVEQIRTRSYLAAQVITIGLVCIHTLSSFYGGRAIPGEPFVAKGERVAKDHSELIRWLKKKNQHWIFTNYWIGYRLAFETDEEVRFIHAYAPYSRRIDSYVQEGKKHSITDTPLVLVPAQAELVTRGLDVLRYKFKTTQKSGYTVIYDIAPPHETLTAVPLTAATVSASSNLEMARGAIDGDVNTRWGSAHPQEPGMFYEITLPEPVEVKALDYLLGEWKHDVPRGLEITLERPSGEQVQVLRAEDFEAVIAVTELDSKVRFYVEPGPVSKIRLTQTGSHPIFDWSIAEIELFS